MSITLDELRLGYIYSVGKLYVYLYITVAQYDSL